MFEVVALFLVRFGYVDHVLMNFAESHMVRKSFVERSIYPHNTWKFETKEKLVRQKLIKIDNVIYGLRTVTK